MWAIVLFVVEKKNIFIFDLLLIAYFEKKKCIVEQ